MKRTITLPVVALGLVAAACTSTGSSDGALTTEPNVPAATDAPDSPDEPGTTDVDEPASTDGEPSESGDGSTTTNRPFAFAPAALQRFDECSALLDHIHTEAMERVGPYGLEGNGFFGPEVVFATDDFAVEEAEAAEEPAAEPGPEASGQVLDASLPTSSAAGPPLTDGEGDVDRGSADSGDGTFSTTNVQVEGVDEPDIVKTDGNRIIAIANETLHYFDIAADGTTGLKRGSVALNDLTDGSGDAGPGIASYAYGHEIFFAGDRAFVFARGEVFFDEPFREGPIILDDQILEEAVVDAPDAISETTEITEIDGAASTDAEADAEAGFAPDEDIAIEPIPTEPFPFPTQPSGYFGPQTVVFEVDLSNPDAPAIANSLTLEGNYVSARSIGTTARLVLTSPPAQLGFVYPSGPASEQTAADANRDLIASTTIADWLPTYTFSGADGVESDTIVSCEDVHAPANFAGFDMLSIVSIDLGGPLGTQIGTSTVMAAGDTVYSSQDRMYVSTNVWNPIVDESTQQWLGENYETAIHRFSIPSNAPASYEGSGTVEGHLLNQFSMNDRDGTFYVATTKGAPWSDGTESQIVAMELNGDRLEAVGSVGGLGEGERIFSVRYVDDKAYVVTFRQVDPFYVIDIADPTAMSVLGELKIPGFSSYLHPISPTLVVGVGQDATDEGFTTGTKVSLFDVSDPTDPLEIDVWTLPDAYSDAEFDHRAFLYWPATSTAVLPLQSYADRFAGAVVLNITADGITEQGRLTHAADDDGVVGATDCQVLTLDEIGGDNENSEFFWISQEGGQVQGCTTDQEGGATGLFCDVIPVDDLQYWTENVDQINVDGFDRLEICWPNWDGFQYAIQRTMVIDDTLWTLSNTQLQANSLDTLERTAALPTN